MSPVNPSSINGWRHQIPCKKGCVVTLDQVDVFDESQQTNYTIPRYACVVCGWPFEMNLTKEVKG